MPSLINVLKNYSNLSELDLSCNDISYESSKALNLLLIESTILKTLNLSKCLHN